MNLNSYDAVVFTDGASKGNPGPGGWGAIIFVRHENNRELRVESLKSQVIELGGREAHTTNNRMELRAAIEALVFLQNQGSTLDRKKGLTFILYSDSSYVINGITKWVHGWKKNNWETTQKKEVENQDLWAQLTDLASKFSIQWKQIAGHADTPGNARADEIASAFAEGATPRLYNGPRDKYPINFEIIGTGRNQNKRRSAHSYVSVVGGVIEIHKTWDECKRRVEGKHGARFKKVFSKEEEEALVQDFRRNNQK